MPPLVPLGSRWIFSAPRESAGGSQLNNALLRLAGAHTFGYVFVRPRKRTQFFHLLGSGHLIIGLGHVLLHFDATAPVRRISKLYETA